LYQLGNKALYGLRMKTIGINLISAFLLATLTIKTKAPYFFAGLL
jgi:hypothetical protein